MQKDLIRRMVIALLTAAAVFGFAGCAADTSAQDATPPDESTTENVSSSTEEAAEEEAWWEELPLESWSQFEKIDVANSWFEVYRLPGDTYAIYEPKQWELAISYLILGEDKALLLDSGTGIANIKEVAEELTSLPISLLNSHSHFDHIGNNALFDDIYYYDSDFTREALVRGEEHDAIAEEVSEEAIHGETPEGFDPEKYAIEGKEPTTPITGGDTIDLGGRTLEIMYTPGHAPDSIMLYDEANALLFTGDAYYPSTLYCLSDGCDLDLYAKTMREVADQVSTMNVEWLYTSHNETTKDLSQLGLAADALEAIADGSKTDYETMEDFIIEGKLRLFTFPETGIEVLVREAEFEK